MGKKVVYFIFFLFLFHSVCFGLTENEIKYKWNKLDLQIESKSGLTMEWSQYKSSDFQKGMLSASSQNIKNWHIIKGGAYISEIDFLNTIKAQTSIDTDKEKTDEIIKRINDDMSYRKTWQGFWTLVTLPSLYLVFDKGKTNISEGYGWVGVVAICGYMIKSLEPPQHYLRYNEVGEKIDQYNEKLKKDLDIAE